MQPNAPRSPSPRNAPQVIYTYVGQNVTPSPSDWRVRLGESICANMGMMRDAPLMRIKKDVFRGKPVTTIKQNRNRVRICLYHNPAANTVLAQAYYMPVPDGQTILKPHYDDLPNHETLFSLTSQFVELVQFCTLHLSAPTPYVTDDFDKIEVYPSDSDQSPRFGLITGVMADNNGNWEIVVNGGTRRAEMLKATAEQLKNIRPMVGMYLIFNSTENERMMVTEHDFLRYYEVVGDDDEHDDQSMH